MKISKIRVKNKNTDYLIFVGNKSLNLLKKQVKKLCPKTKKVGLILDRKIPNKYKKEIKKQLSNNKLYIYEYQPNENLKSFYSQYNIENPEDKAKFDFPTPVGPEIIIIGV